MTVREQHAAIREGLTYAPPKVADPAIRALVELEQRAEQAERRLRHSEFHRTCNRRRMRRLGKYQTVLEKKIVRQRDQLRAYSQPKKTTRPTAIARAAELHHSLRTEESV